MKALLVAIVGGVLICVSPLDGQTARPDQELRTLVERYWTAWGTGDPVKAAPLYSQEPSRVFFDREPLKFNGWVAYQAGVVPAILSKFSAIRFAVNDDLVSGRDGNLAFTAVTVVANGSLKASGPISVTMRHTVIWQRIATEWLIVHEHVSVPSSLPPAPPGK